MGAIAIRRAVAADVDGFVATSTALFAEDAGTRDDTVDLEWPRKYGAQRFNETVGDPNRLTLVAVDEDGPVVGHLSGLLGEATSMRPVRVATLLSLYVRPAHRGSGVGARLVAGFRAWSRDHGMDRMEVTAYAANAGALRFYEREGFVAQSVVLEAKPSRS
jgi:GNAT superfamily N-acetyltransferase